MQPPIDGSPPGSPIPGILPARTLEWVAISFSKAWKWKVKGSCSVVSDSSRPHGLQPTRLLRPWDSPGRSTGVGYHCLLQEIQLVHPKGDQFWVFTGRTDAKAETPILWPPHAKSWLIGKDSDAGRDWGAGGEGDNRGWNGWKASLINGHEFKWTPGVGDGQGGLECCNSWGHKETRLSDWTKLNWGKKCF